MHESYMQRALQLASLGIGKVAPNPMVGCVIVYEDKIIGEGWHQQYGKAHAEVNAIDSVAHQELLPQSTLYVSLEPCSHFGKTPPCADLLVRKNVGKVIIACTDPNPLVAGKGIRKLQEAGIPVEVGVLEKEARYLNKRFFTFIEKKRPYILLKWAQTQDGFLARSNYDSKWISNIHSRTLVHQWRSQEQAIMVATHTALHDNPQLNVREWSGKNPVRIVIDKTLQIPTHYHLLDRSQPTLCYNLLKNESTDNLIFVKLEADSFLENLLQDLYERKIQSVMVEGGSRLLQTFIEKNLWDEARIFVGDICFGEGILAPKLPLQNMHQKQIFEDKLLYFENISSCLG
jgi:diaminohydroxyphosphoribosylaminopyrimidine deaminase/5-amino-6-(5-phosphoribosylamino)uracil reductase